MSIIDKKADDYLIYRYTVNELYILFSDGAYKLENERLNSLSILDRYMENLYPIMKIDLALEESVYNRIISEKDDLKIKLNVRKYYRKNSETEKSFESNYINDTFQLILDDSINTVDVNAHNLEYPEGDTGEMNSVQVAMELFLFKGDMIKANSKMVNAVLKEASVSAAIGYILTKSQVSNLLMTRPDNQTIYEELKLPPLNIAKELAFVDSYYGLYNTGSIIYFGLDRGYIIPFCKPSDAYERNEIETVCIIVPEIGSTITDNICSLKKYNDSTKAYFIADPESFDPKNLSTTGNVLHPEDINVVENETGEVTKSKEKNKATEILLSENPFYKEIYEATVKSNDAAISVSLKDGDFSLLTPNKKYQFIFESTKLSKIYKGYYHLCQCDISLAKEGVDFTAGAQCLFRKSVV